jgi:predicted DNA-binding WGR domain protein
MSSLRNRVIRLAYDNSELRTVLLPLLKKAHGPVALKAPDVMLYMIVKGENKSKFYEMGVFPASRAPRAKKDKGDTNGDWVLSKHWGRLTDSGGTGRIDSMNEYFFDERSAEAAMSKHKAAKTRKGYQDISREREYPIGLGAAGFGWGGQAVCSIQPELFQLQGEMSDAQEALNNGLRMVAPLSRTDSTMAKKLTGLLGHALADVSDITAYLDQQLAECR